MKTAVEDLHSLRLDVADREPALREKVAAGTFLMQFYNGVENVLKRISAYHGVGLPTGERWHTDLFLRFCDPPREPLPILFDSVLQNHMRPYRTFRHIARTGYGIELDWGRVIVCIEEIASVYDRFRVAVIGHLDNLP